MQGINQLRADDQVYEIKDEGKITYKGLGGVYLRILNG